MAFLPRTKILSPILPNLLIIFQFFPRGKDALIKVFYDNLQKKECFF